MRNAIKRSWWAGYVQNKHAQCKHKRKENYYQLPTLTQKNQRLETLLYSNGFSVVHADVGRLAVTHTGRAEPNGHSPHKPPDSPPPGLPWEEPGGEGGTPPGTSPTSQ